MKSSEILEQVFDLLQKLEPEGQTWYGVVAVSPAEGAHCITALVGDPDPDKPLLQMQVSDGLARLVSHTITANQAEQAKMEQQAAMRSQVQQQLASLPREEIVTMLEMLAKGAQNAQ